MNFVVILLLAFTCVLAANPSYRQSAKEHRAQMIKKMRESPQERLYHSDRFPDRNTRYDELLAAAQYDELFNQISAWMEADIPYEIEQLALKAERLQEEFALAEERERTLLETRRRLAEIQVMNERQKAQKSKCTIC